MQGSENSIENLPKPTKDKSKKAKKKKIKKRSGSTLQLAPRVRARLNDFLSTYSVRRHYRIRNYNYVPHRHVMVFYNNNLLRVTEAFLNFVLPHVRVGRPTYINIDNSGNVIAERINRFNRTSFVYMPTTSSGDILVESSAIQHDTPGVVYVPLNFYNIDIPSILTTYSYNRSITEFLNYLVDTDQN